MSFAQISCFNSVIASEFLENGQNGHDVVKLCYAYRTFVTDSSIAT